MSLISKRIPLSQGLKLVERLKRLVNESQTQLNALASAVIVSFASEQSKVEDRQAEVDAKLAEVTAIYDVLVQLRTKIGNKNGEIGINAIQAEEALLRNQQSGLETLLYSLSHQGNAIDLNLVGEALTRLERKDELPKIQVKVISAERAEQIKASVRVLERRILVLNDEKHRLNGNSFIEVEIPEALAEQVGLAS